MTTDDPNSAKLPRHQLGDGDIDSRIDELIARGLERFGAGDIEGAVGQWQVALILDDEDDRVRGYLEYVGRHFGIGDSAARTAVASPEAELLFPFGVEIARPTVPLDEAFYESFELLPTEAELEEKASSGTRATTDTEEIDAGWSLDGPSGEFDTAAVSPPAVHERASKSGTRETLFGLGAVRMPEGLAASVELEAEQPPEPERKRGATPTFKAELDAVAEGLAALDMDSFFDPFADRTRAGDADQTQRVHPRDYKSQIEASVEVLESGPLEVVSVEAEAPPVSAELDADEPPQSFEIEADEPPQSFELEADEPPHLELGDSPGQLFDDEPAADMLSLMEAETKRPGELPTIESAVDPSESAVDPTEAPTARLADPLRFPDDGEAQPVEPDSDPIDDGEAEPVAPSLDAVDDAIAAIDEAAVDEVALDLDDLGDIPGEESFADLDSNVGIDVVDSAPPPSPVKVSFKRPRTRKIDDSDYYASVTAEEPPASASFDTVKIDSRPDVISGRSAEDGAAPAPLPSQARVEFSGGSPAQARVEFNGDPPAPSPTATLPLSFDGREPGSEVMSHNLADLEAQLTGEDGALPDYSGALAFDDDAVDQNAGTGGMLPGFKPAPETKELQALPIEDADIGRARAQSEADQLSLHALRDQIRQLVDLGAENDESGPHRTRRRVKSFIDYARDEHQAGHHAVAVAAVDLALEEDPESAAAQKIVHEVRELCFQIYRSYIGDLGMIPALAVPITTIPTERLDHRSAFLLSRIDGLMSFEDILDVSGMPRLEAYRHLSRLLMQGILEVRV